MNTSSTAVEGVVRRFDMGTELGTKKIVCIGCGGGSEWIFRARDLNRRASTESFEYYRCPNCRTLQISPIPSDLGKYYTKYPAHQIPKSEMELRDSAEKYRGRLKFVQRFIGGGRLLEIGGSYGGFAYLAKQAGFDVDMLEMDTQCCEFMENVGVKTINAASTDAIQDAYDVITLWHSLEHFGDYLKVVSDAASHLRPGGILVIATPNPEAAQLRMFGRLWVGVDAPRHLALVPFSVLETSLAHVGLRIAYASASDEDGRASNVWSWEYSMMNAVASWGLMPTESARTLLRAGKVFAATRRLVVKIAAQILARICSVAFAAFERTAMRGCQYSAVFRNVGTSPVQSGTH
jgi:2-polyprenyl-3-methyl-5-hydroxy-6-metoxy-1,4-benzoquinol methylase